MDEIFEKWIEKWDAASKEIESEALSSKKQISEPIRTSYFTGTPSSYDPEKGEESLSDNWLDIYHRATELDYNDSLLTETKVDSSVKNKNPIQSWSIGKDQEDEKGLVPVTNNWSDGKELRQLDKIKKKVMDLEYEFHKVDVMKSGNSKELQFKLRKLRKKVNDLSEKIGLN